MSKLALQYVVFFISGILLMCTSFLLFDPMPMVVGEMPLGPYLDILFNQKPLAILALCVGALFLIMAHVCYKNLPDEK